MEKKEVLDIAQLLLPQGILDYFNLNDIKQSQKELHFYLEERNIVPQEFKSEKLTSKGFLNEISVQDFPIRGKDVFLIIKRRRWYNQNTGSIVCRNWELVANGTRMTKEFAAFLKVISRYEAR